MKIIKKLYKTSLLYKNGVFITIILIIFLLIGYLIPDKKPECFQNQIYTLNGFNVKYDDNAEVSDFFLSIKKNHGFLVMGTSETVAREDGNYHDFLNEDKDLNGIKFSVLAGAGRTCGTYIPLFLRHEKDLNSLQLIYFINPVYWRGNLCQMNLQYWNRYTQYQVCNSIPLNEKEQKQYYKPVNAYVNKLNFFNKGIAYVEYFLRDARRNYFCDLRNILFPLKYGEQFQFVSDTMSNYLSGSKYNTIDLERIDTVWNISKSFQHKNWYQPINESDNNRFIELTSFIHLCRDLEIKACFIICPYNERFIQQYDPDGLAGHQRIVQKIKQILIEQNVDFIDATDISSVAGTFVDHQHHSSFGAYLIYKRIKQKINEKKTN